MSMLGTLFRKIFPASHPAAQAATTSTTAAAPSTPSAPSSAPATSAPAAPAATPSASATAPQVDIEAVLNDMAKKNPEKLNWRTSIVDLMKLVGMDSSINARKELAHELGYTGDTNDSASMNIWLHKQVMRKIAENGGKVPADLQH